MPGAAYYVTVQVPVQPHCPCCGCVVVSRTTLPVLPTRYMGCWACTPVMVCAVPVVPVLLLECCTYTACATGVHKAFKPCMAQHPRSCYCQCSGCMEGLQMAVTVLGQHGHGMVPGHDPAAAVQMQRFLSRGWQWSEPNGTSSGSIEKMQA